MASSINLVNLVDYVNQINPEIQKEAVLKGRFVDQISHMPGIKNAEVINGIRSTLVLTAPTCGTILSPTGSVTPFQQTVTVCQLASQETLCVADFEKKYYGMYAKLGSYNEDVTEKFSAVYLADKVDKLQKAIEETLIASSTSGTFSSTATTLCNGLLYNLAVTNTATVIPAGLTLSYNLTNAVEIIDQMVAKIPSDILGEQDLTLWLSYADFITYFRALRNTNWFNFNPFDAKGNMFYEIPYPGAVNIKISALMGLGAVTNSKHYFIATYASNLFYGYDDSKDFEKFQFFYSELTDAVNFRSKFKVGVGVAYPEYVVYGVSN